MKTLTNTPATTPATTNALGAVAAQIAAANTQAATTTTTKPKRASKPASAESKAKAAATKQATKPASKAETKTETKPAPTLYAFNAEPPRGYKELRAYMLGFIIAQLGGLVVGKAFRLWPNANVSGHVSSGKLKREDGAKYSLTAAGYNAFTDPASIRTPSPEMQAEALQAIKTGQAPKWYSHKMIALK